MIGSGACSRAAPLFFPPHLLSFRTTKITLPIVWTCTSASLGNGFYVRNLQEGVAEALSYELGMATGARDSDGGFLTIFSGDATSYTVKSLKVRIPDGFGYERGVQEAPCVSLLFLCSDKA